MIDPLEKCNREVMTPNLNAHPRPCVALYARPAILPLSLSFIAVTEGYRPGIFFYRTWVNLKIWTHTLHTRELTAVATKSQGRSPAFCHWFLNGNIRSVGTQRSPTISDPAPSQTLLSDHGSRYNCLLRKSAPSSSAGGKRSVVAR